MGDLTTGYTLVSGETVTPTKLNGAVNDAVINANAVTTAKINAGAVTASKVAAGMIVQVVQGTNSAYTTSAATIPSDDTVPLVSEGTQILTAAITPNDAANKVLVQVNVPLLSTNTTNTPILALFRGSTCIGAAAQSLPANYLAVASMEILDAPATTSATTYTVRVGLFNASGTFQINGISSRLFGGAAAATITLIEVKG
jgi:hypothetical protein